MRRPLPKVQAQVRQRILRAFVRRGLINKRDRDEMMSWEHGGGFSLDASVCISGTDRAGLERLLRYCARPPFALEHLPPLDAEHLLYHNPKPRSDSPRDLVLTPLELIDKIAALIPPPRANCHRYYGVLAPNFPMRAASHYMWAMLLARIYETLPLVCPVCQSPMHIIAFITDAGTVRKILDPLSFILRT